MCMYVYIHVTIFSCIYFLRKRKEKRGKDEDISRSIYVGIPAYFYLSFCFPPHTNYGSGVGEGVAPVEKDGMLQRTVSTSERGGPKLEGDRSLLKGDMLVAALTGMSQWKVPKDFVYFLFCFNHLVFCLNNFSSPYVHVRSTVGLSRGCLILVKTQSIFICLRLCLIGGVTTKRISLLWLT